MCTSGDAWDFVAMFLEKARVGGLYLASRVSLRSRDESGRQWESFGSLPDKIYLNLSASQLHKTRLCKTGFMCLHYEIFES